MTDQSISQQKKPPFQKKEKKTERSFDSNSAIINRVNVTDTPNNLEKKEEKSSFTLACVHTSHTQRLKRNKSGNLINTPHLTPNF